MSHKDIKPTDMVKYIGCSKEQIRWGNNNDPTGILVESQCYCVEKVEVHSQHTKLILQGINGKFNSVCFTTC